ncbi:MAG: hypothetical protein COT71_00640 [Candidatus Andersenbacteria bacterium CG10_big_fil_rev_8_21_14_0_10_54_11]|uniref:DUF8173 domain-containing protein n=1 Tax=Candidatus Andersenbacteria bacterium CG10_big_fil_rev_8_21_14_0_10_54_11 TaxID=1974485 RepID=A0A2M6X093_9BACT|nr:MAG: hypothetical protein COT71_00640 [Candidatus Andersenbacteria bacterium CG10_big_fil_rev_8_21_14_0_10_54_11]
MIHYMCLTHLLQITIRSGMSLGVLGAILVPGSATAAEFLTGQQDLTSTTAPVQDDLYTAGKHVDIDEPVRDDVFAAGSTVTVRAAVGKNIFAAGETVSVTAPIGDDFHAAGTTVRISGTVAGDVFTAGRRVLIDRSAQVDGNVYAAGGEVVIEGSVGGDVRSAGQQTSVADGASIGGDLLTFGGAAPRVADGARIGGMQRHRTHTEKPRDMQAILGRWVRSTLGWFILAVLLLYVFPRFAQRSADTALARTGEALGAGAAWLLLGVPIAIVLGAVVIGWPAVVLTVFGTAAGMVAASALAVLFAGAWFLKVVTKTAQPLLWQHALVGAVALKLVQLVPVLGGLLLLVLTTILLGAGWLVMRQSFGRNKQPTAGHD